MKLWRISNYADLSGRGGLFADGRWHSRGRLVVYAADHPSTCLLEILVHIELAHMPDDYQLLCISLPADVDVFAPALPDKWQTKPAKTRAIGDAFLTDGTRPVMAVPSAVMPEAVNYVLNPRHQAVQAASLEVTARYPFDSRLLGK